LFHRLVVERLQDKLISEDDEKRGLEDVQKITDQEIKVVDELQAKKDAELLSR
jgi:ribosome recycling factor